MQFEVEEDAWDLTSPGRFQDLVRERFPGRPRNHASLQAGVQPTDVPQSAAIQVAQVMRVQFPTDDGNRFIGLAPNSVSVHLLPPYAGWDVFQEDVEFGLAAYQKLVPTLGVTRVGLRYINGIDLPLEDEFNYETYFVDPPQMPRDHPRLLRSVLTRLEGVYDDDHRIVLIRTFAMGAHQDRPSHILDLDVVWQADENAPGAVADVVQIVRDLKRRETEAFENSITDETRNLFG